MKLSEYREKLLGAVQPYQDRITQLESENAKLKRLVTEQELTLESYRIKLDRFGQEIIPAMENEHAALKRVRDAASEFVSYDGQDIYYGTPKQGMKLISALADTQE